ncbi:flagellar hook-basal body protein [Calidifontibacillus oryziterrae]|uniref:flagellar hook-basal body protein n=1 Tax=Calidifontibacillus oryziterrae TaxID=1191699 RepID=UPI0002F5FDB6|nr:flagellar hook-basal body protein [Calidifontibacillus oryziterrae]
MLRGFYTAAAGMISQQRRQEMLTNNLANANTPGFKEDQGSLRAFPEMLITSMNTETLPVTKRYQIKGAYTVGPINTGVYMQETQPKFRQGDIQETGNQTDIALVDVNLPINEETNRPGALFIQVLNADGEPRYTRNGNFTIDGEGYLTTNDGYYVTDTYGAPIIIYGNEFTITSDGRFFEDGEDTDQQLNIVYAENPDNLVKEGNGLFRVEGAGQELPSAIEDPEIVFQVKQKFIERSNVDIEQTMTEMMMAYRTFEANQKILKAYDSSMEKAVNEIGRIR